MKTNNTEDTRNSDLHIDFSQEIADLENKIILKRDVKIELN